MDNLNGSLNPWMIPLTFGGAALAGFVTGKMFGDRRRGAKTILKLVTNDFKKEGPLAGSWIDYQPIPFQRFAYKTTAYRGGLRRQEDDQLVNYEFLADAYTGSIIELKRMN